MADTFARITDETMRATSPPKLTYYFVLLLLLGGVGMLGLAWLYQIEVGMGVAGIHQPVSWGFYISNFVFWVGIAHSGTLISAILYLVRARWREAISRASEAMTVFAIAVAGLFPLIHMGRLWVVYYILPYPTQRNIYPNFVSPLVWDVVAISTYFTVSIVFFTVGLIPDAAAARDWSLERGQGEGLKGKFYRLLSLGWSGAASQWRHYDRAYLYFAAMATPLVISVHSIVSWDFAMSLLNGWHTTIYAPFFVAGAIHSGLAMVLVLMIPMRRILKLENLIRPYHFEMIGKILILTTAIMGYSYVVEPLIVIYSGEHIEIQYIIQRATDYLAPVYWSLIPLNVLLPALLVFKKVRTNIKALGAISVGIIAGMYLERALIVVEATSFDYMPHNWSRYFPEIEIPITIGSFCLFFFAFLAFVKILPTVPIADLKALDVEEEVEEAAHEFKNAGGLVAETADLTQPGVMAVYDGPAGLIRAVGTVMAKGWLKIEAFSPTKLPQLMEMLGWSKSPIRFVALAGGVLGLVGGFWLPIATALENSLFVGGKGPMSLVPYCLVGFEGAVLLGSLANAAGLVYLAKLYGFRTKPNYERRFSRDKFGLFVQCDPAERAGLIETLKAAGAEEIHER